MTAAHRLLSTVLIVAAYVSAASAEVITVDPTGVGEPALQLAIDTASDGDILLLQPGDYLANSIGITISGKGISLVADGGGARPELRRVAVTDTPAGSTVILRGLEFSPLGFFFLTPNALFVNNCTGSVWIEDCIVGGPPPDGAGLGGDRALGVYDSHSVHVTRSTIIGGGASTTGACSMIFSAGFNPGGTAAFVSDSNVAFHDCVLLGADGGPPLGGLCSAHRASGGAGLRVEGGFALVSGCVLSGGLEGPVAIDSTGGDAVVLSATATLWTMDSTLTPGSTVAGGPPTGETIDAALGASVTTLAGKARTIRINSPLRPGQAGVLGLDGKLNDTLGFFWSFDGAFLPLPGKSGVFALATPFQGAFVLGVNPTGNWDIPFLAPPLPPGFTGLTFLVQVAALDPDSGDLVLGGVTTLALVDA